MSTLVRLRMELNCIGNSNQLHYTKIYYQGLQYDKNIDKISSTVADLEECIDFNEKISMTSQI